jgi:hypothetical protein
MDLGELIPLLGLVLVIGCTGIAVAGAYVLGRSRRGDQHVAPPRDEEAHARLERVEHALEALTTEMERIGEGQRFIVKVMGEGAPRPAVEKKNAMGRVITPH